jgi:hypothetical protein
MHSLPPGSPDIAMSIPETSTAGYETLQAIVVRSISKHRRSVIDTMQAVVGFSRAPFYHEYCRPLYTSVVSAASIPENHRRRNISCTNLSRRKSHLDKRSLTSQKLPSSYHAPKQEPKPFVRKELM